MTITTIRHCARCDGTHINLEIKPLTKEVIGGNLETIANYWGMCPVANEPILLVYVPEQSSLKEVL